MFNIVDKRNEIEIKEYEDFTSNHKNGCFMQSINWAKVKNNWNYEAVCVRDENGELKGTALILIKTLPIVGCSFFYCPHGPVCDYSDKNTLSEIFSAIKELSAKYKAYQLKVDPCITESDYAAINTYRSLGFTYRENAPELTTIQARNNYMLSLDGKTKEEVFAAFHKKWRYNIRVAERHGVVCRTCGKEALDDFYRLMVETGKRDGFSIRSKEYFAKMLDSLEGSSMLYMCYHEGKALSGALCVRYAGKSCYVYGASTAENRKLMPNYLMQWTMICDAIDSGCVIHDFQGIPFYKDESHPNYGVYRFKSGFNGGVVTYAGEFDLSYKRSLRFISEKMQKLRSRIHRLNTKIIIHNSGRYMQEAGVKNF